MDPTLWRYTLESVGLTKVLYEWALVSCGQFDRFLVMKVRLLLAFLAIVSTCGSHERSTEIIVPNYRPVIAMARLCPMDRVVGVNGVPLSCDAEELALRGVE